MGVLMVVNGQDLKRCGAATCTAQTLTDIATNLNNMEFVATSGSDILFVAAPSDPYIVYQCGVTGCPGAGPNQIESLNENVGALVAGPNHGYWTRANNCSTYSRRCSLPNCTNVADVRPIVNSCANNYTSTANVTHELIVPSTTVSAGANTVVWGTGGTYNGSGSGIRGCPIGTTCNTWTEITAGGPSALAYFNGNHYAANNANIYSVADTAGAATKTDLASDAAGIVGMAVDASGIYWVNATTGSVKRCAKLTGCTTGEIETLAVGQTGAIGIAIDTNNVYWAMPTKVMRVVK